MFLDTYNVDLTNDKLTFPEDQETALRDQFAAADPPNEGLVARDDVLEWEDGDKCIVDGSEENAELKVVVWNNFTDTDDGTTYIADFNNIRLDRDQMVVAVAFVPDDTDVSMPPWAPELPSLGEIDSGVVNPADQLAPVGSVPSDSIPTDATSDAPTTTEG